MSTYDKSLLLIGLAVVTGFIGMAGQWTLPKPWGFVMLVAGFALAFVAGRIRCPQCGERVSSRPWSLFGSPMTIGAGFPHTRCYLCGYDLRELVPPRR